MAIKLSCSVGLAGYREIAAGWLAGGMGGLAAR